MKPQIKWSQAIFVFALLPLVFELTFISLMFYMLEEVDRSRAVRTREVNSAFESSRFMDALVEQGSAAVAAKIGMEGGTKREMISGSHAVDKAADKLMAYWMSDPEQSAMAVKFHNYYYEFGRSMKTAGKRFAEGNMLASMKLRFRAMGCLQQLLNISTEYQSKQLERASSRAQQELKTKSTMQILLIVFFVLSIAIAGMLALFLNRNIARKLTALSARAQSLATLESLPPAIEGNDEFANLDKAFHAMSEAVNEALNQEKLVVDGATDMICSLDDNAVFTRVNPASQRLLSYEPGDIVGKEIFAFVISNQRQICRTEIEKAKASHEPVSFETAMQDAHGKTVETLWTTSWSDAEKSLFCVVHDITERKQAERLRLELTAMLSHDLRTPITSVQVALDMMSAGVFGELPQPTSSKVARAARSSLQAMYLINDLLDIEKFETSEIPLFVVAADVREIIEDALRDLRAIAQDKDVSIDVACDNVKIFVDKEQFTRVIRNLLRNSIANSPGFSAIHICAQAHETQCLITIKDSGPLIADSEKQLLFERFRDTENAASKRLEGSGLSLPVCRALVNAHKGELSAETSLDGKFTFLLKVAASQKTAAL